MEHLSREHSCMLERCSGLSIRFGTSRHRPKLGAAVQSGSGWLRAWYWSGDNGQRLGGANGLAPTVGNSAVGLNVTLAFSICSIHAREASQAATLKRNVSRTLVGRQLQEQFAQAQAALRAMHSIAKKLLSGCCGVEPPFPGGGPHKAGLSSIDDVAQAQRLVGAGRVDDSIAAP